jgi:hypothetical protein
MLQELITETKSIVPAFAGATVLAITARPKSAVEAVASIVAGVLVSYYTTPYIVDKLQAAEYVAPVGFLMGFMGQTIAKLAHDYGPRLLEAWANRTLNHVAPPPPPSPGGKDE